jgi:hypothetical protein
MISQQSQSELNCIPERRLQVVLDELSSCCHQQTQNEINKSHLSISGSHQDFREIIKTHLRSPAVHFSDAISHCCELNKTPLSIEEELYSSTAWFSGFSDVPCEGNMTPLPVEGIPAVCLSEAISYFYKLDKTPLPSEEELCSPAMCFADALSCAFYCDENKTPLPSPKLSEPKLRFRSFEFSLGDESSHFSQVHLPSASTRCSCLHYLRDPNCESTSAKRSYQGSLPEVHCGECDEFIPLRHWKRNTNPMSSHKAAAKQASKTKMPLEDPDSQKTFSPFRYPKDMNHVWNPYEVFKVIPQKHFLSTRSLVPSYLTFIRRF